MRISYTREHEIKEQIEKDLYTQPRQLLNKKKNVLVKANHKLWLSQYENTLKLLPDSMIQTTDTLRLKVPTVSFEEFDLPESERAVFDVYPCNEDNWRCDIEKALPSLMETTSYYHSSSLPVPLQESLKDEIIALRIEEHNFEKEKRDLKHYLNKTFDACSTTTKLRKAWPSTLQKYIPPEPDRAARRPKPKVTVEPDTLIAPTDALKQRMTENLLQG